MNVKKQVFLVLGVSKSGYSATKYILENGAKCYIFEDFSSEKVNLAIEELKTSGAIFITRENIDEIIKEIDVLVISPGVKITHDVAVKAKARGKRIISEFEFGYFSLIPEFIAVTGTNGKTTTVNLINEIYKRAQINTELIGNVGTPISERIKEISKDTVCIAEISSFQLESTASFCPHIACVLNVAPDHLERHFNMDNYVFLKKRIFKNQKESEYTVLNFDDQTVRSFYTETKAKVVWVSKTEKVDGAYCENGKIYFRDEFILNENNLSIKGKHNLENALFAVAVAKIDDIPNEIIASSLSEFKGVEHRIQLIDKISGVSFYNDSKSTNTASCVSALESVNGPIILLLGGKDKGEKFDDLMEKIKTRPVKHLVIYGESRRKISECAINHGLNDVTVTSKFDTALKISAILSCAGDNVLLSPACSSYDEFSGFEERGKKFCEFVESLK